MTFIKTQDLMSLAGKCALVTGGARGIGAAIAMRLADAGADIVLTDIRAEGIAEVAKAIKEAGGNAFPIVADLSSADDRDRLVAEAQAQARHGGIDLLVNNAGLRDWFTWETLDEAHWDRFMTVNLKAPFFLSQAVAKAMVARGKGGAMVNIASTAAAVPVRWKVDYNAAKAGLAMMSKSLARELGEHGIRVNTVGPGGTNTPGGSGSIPDSFSPEMLTKMGQDWRERMALPVGIMEPDDIARSVLFFCSDLSSCITGQTLFVDGGYLVG